MPLIEETLEPYWQCFTECDSQLRGTGGSIYALDWSIVFKVAEVHGLNIDEKFILYLKAFEGTMIEKIKEGGT